MIIADFTITVHYEDIPRAVRVMVYDTLASLRSAATRYDNLDKRKTRRKRGQHADTLGICHRFEWRDEKGATQPECALVRLAKPYLGVGIVSHEFAHAAVWIRELNGEDDPLTAGNDEPFAWLLGELVRQAINAMNERGVYDGSR